MMKTYGRSPWRVYDDDQRPAAKKRRVLSDSESDAAEKSLQYAIRESTANVRSSPSRRNSIALSDGSQDDDLSTPPSSPPPRLTPPPQNTRKPTFSFLKRKHSATDGATNGSPLSEVNSNSVRASLDPPKKKAATSTSQQLPALKQMQLDLGHEVRKTCATCGMEYIPSNAEDASLHKKFHDMNSTGVDLGKAFMRANASRWVYEATRFDEGYVVIVDRKSSPTAKNQAKKVLEVLSKELSSPVIEDEVLWSQTEPPKHLRKNGATEKVDRYKVFLHMKDSRCVGACLTERIWESHPVDKGSAQKDGADAAVAVGDASHPAIVGISRIWTSGSSRRKGIAMDLLDCVVSNFIYGMEIPKEQVAFSQPTNSGKSLAQAFFGLENEWHVYKENLAKHSPRQTTPSSSDEPDPIFISPSSTAATKPTQSTLPSAASASASITPPPLNAPNLDDPTISDDQSTSDPFGRAYDASDHEPERTQTSSETPTIAPPGDLPPQETIRHNPPSFPYLNDHAVVTPSREHFTRHIKEKHTDQNGRLWDRATIASSLMSNQSSSSSEASDSDSAADEPPQLQANARTLRRPVSLGPGVDPISLNNRLAHRDRIPPPPPKSHHGKRISTGPSIVLPPSQTTPGKAANRVSFHSSSPGSLASPRILQTEQDYFSTPLQTNQSVPLADLPRRSQSQNKRPPTPPISRRHSQMRRSKSTLSKPASSRLPMPLAEVEATASSPPSPGSQPLTPLRSRDPNYDSYFPDETRSVSSLRQENLAPSPSVPPAEIGLGIQPDSRTTSKRASIVTQLPPLPPPRRTRGSKHGNDKDGRLRSEQRADGSENFAPHPSNAKDILADLTRLQKEVDDLRGQYENQR
ncbi:hypothetical protein BJY00DRAFT_300473 [Aspergillus carlsbadensis]|nr:hypothetical protein BJY00DRAFT_300473 [Aspergillus carlsbadensis]